MNGISETRQRSAQIISLSAYRRPTTEDDGSPPPGPMAARCPEPPTTLDLVSEERDADYRCRNVA
jgi:hypothetical protein